MGKKLLAFILAGVIGLNMVGCKKKLPLPERFQKLQNYKQEAKGIEIGNFTLYGSVEVRKGEPAAVYLDPLHPDNPKCWCFQTHMYLNPERGQVTEYYQYKSGCTPTPGRETYPQPSFYHFDLNNNDRPWDGDEYVYDFNRNGLSGDEIIGSDYHKEFNKFIKQGYDK